MTAADLGAFEGRDTIQQRLTIGGKATGLNEALALEPNPHAQGSEVFLVIRGRVKVGFEPIKDTDCDARVEHVMITEADFVDAGLVTELLEAQTRRIEELKGIQRLALEPNQEMVEAHQRNEHTEPEFGCPICDEEEMAKQEAEAEGNGATPIGRGRRRGASGK